MTKISKHEWFLSIAETVSQRWTCNRRQVWSVLVKDWVIISTWINWNARGESECVEKWCTIENWHCISTIHSEVNSIINCARTWISTVWSVLYCTDKPCSNCSRVIINAWIKEVYYRNHYDWDYTIELSDYIKVNKI